MLFGPERSHSFAIWPTSIWWRTFSIQTNCCPRRRIHRNIRLRRNSEVFSFVCISNQSSAADVLTSHFTAKDLFRQRAALLLTSTRTAIHQSCTHPSIPELVNTYAQVELKRAKKSQPWRSHRWHLSPWKLIYIA